jgi:DNA-binding NarL/FixJ family response regulator
MSQKIKIIVSEKNELFRKSLASLLKTKPEFDVVNEAANGRELLEHLKKKHIDIVLLDSEIPIVDCKTSLEIITKRFPDTRVIVLSAASDAEQMSDFMARGAGSYICKNCDVETLFKALLLVKTEGYFFDNLTSKALLDSIQKKKQTPEHSSDSLFNERETEIMKKICDGKTNKEIATSLHLSASAIDFYRTRIYGKTRCNNATGLLKYALKNGIVALS